MGEVIRLKVRPKQRAAHEALDTLANNLTEFAFCCQSERLHDDCRDITAAVDLIIGVSNRFKLAVGIPTHEAPNDCA